MRRLLPFTLALAGTLWLGCSDVDPFSPRGVAGIYLLTTVNGQTLPYETTNNDETLTLSAGSVELVKTGAYTLSLVVSFLQQGTPTTTTLRDAGTFALAEPNSVRLVDTEGNETVGTLDGNRLAFTLEGDAFVFEK